MISFVGYNLHVARSSRWVDVPTSLHEGLDGILVEMVSRELLSAGLQEKDLIIRCNGKRVTTNLQVPKYLYYYRATYWCDIYHSFISWRLLVLLKCDQICYFFHLAVCTQAPFFFLSWL
jgi:hypothetical protein